MNLTKKQLSLLNTIRGWSETDVLNYLKNNNLEEYSSFCETKELNGYALLSLSEGLIAMWRPKVDARKFIIAIEDLKQNPQKYIGDEKSVALKNSQDLLVDMDLTCDLENVTIGKIKPKVPIRSVSLKNYSKNVDPNIEDSGSDIHIDRISLENLQAPKSFLYCPKLKMFENKSNPYTQMSPSSEQIKSNINEEILSKVLEVSEDSINVHDRGYYEMARESDKCTVAFGQPERSIDNPYEELDFGSLDIDKKKTGILQRIWRQKKDEKRTIEISTSEELTTKKMTTSRSIKPKKFNNYNVYKESDDDSEDHLKEKYKKISEISLEDPKIIEETNNNVNVKINDGFVLSANDLINTDNYVVPNSVKAKEMPMNKRTVVFFDVKNQIFIGSEPKQFETSEYDESTDEKHKINYELYEKNGAPMMEHIYETAEFREDIESTSNSIDDNTKTKMIVEEYLEPRKCVFKTGPETMDSLAEEMMKLFDASMEDKQIDKDSITTSASEDFNGSIEEALKDKSGNDQTLPVVMQKPPTPKKPVLPKPICTQPVSASNRDNTTSMDAQKPFDTLQKWNESLRNNVRKKKEINRINMAERPLPIPVENEFYYMEIGRKEAESLLEGQPDGTFILRPSSQSNHAYTVTLMYQGRVYNIGCRKRQDGHLALGFSKITEPHFLTIHDLIEYYYNENLIILVDGKKVGSTVLKRLHP